MEMPLYQDQSRRSRLPEMRYPLECVSSPFLAQKTPHELRGLVQESES